VGTATDEGVGGWSGGDGTGLGGRGEANTGGKGGGDSGTDSFDGQIGLFRVYNEQILTQTEVEVNFDPTTLAFDTNYAVLISADAIEDEASPPNAFAGITDETRWTFTTDPQDLDAPVITSLSPADDGTGVQALDNTTWNFTTGSFPDVLFADSFDRPDSADLNASTARSTTRTFPMRRGMPWCRSI
jgi:hypothetical protein